MMTSHQHFELRRLSDDTVYQFDRVVRPDGPIGYKRRGKDLWIVHDPVRGWVAFNDDGTLGGMPWNVWPQEQGEHPPEGEWVSRKGVKSYVYELQYINIPGNQ